MSSFITRKNLPISSIRVKKFASSEFRSLKNSLNNFNAPFSLREGIRKILHSEFIAPNPKREIFLQNDKQSQTEKLISVIDF